MSNIIFLTILLASLLLSFACSNAQPPNRQTRSAAVPSNERIQRIANPGRVIHVLVALCDNVNQGIVPVSAELGDGDDPVKNLYWGAGNGVKSYFAKSRNWDLISDVKDPKHAVLERLVLNIG